MGWLIFGGYMLGWAFIARKFRAAFIDYEGSVPDLEDKVLSSALAFLVGSVWPVVLLGALMFYKAPKSQVEIREERDAFRRRTRELELENERLRREQENG